MTSTWMKLTNETLIMQLDLTEWVLWSQKELLYVKLSIHTGQLSEAGPN